MISGARLAESPGPLSTLAAWFVNFNSRGLTIVRFLTKNRIMARPISGESVFRALAHSTRREILLALRSGEKSVADLLSPKLASKPTISGHLRALHHAGLVVYRRHGTRLIYRVNTAAIRPVELFVRQLRNGKGT